MRKWSKLLIIPLILSLILPYGTAIAGGANDEDEATVAVDTAKEDESQENAALPVELKARSAVLLEAGSGNILFEMNSHEKMAPASITKIMTLLLVMEALESGKIALEDMATCSEHANSMGGSQIWLEVGEQMSVNDLLKAVCVASANDASVMLAEHVSGSEMEFINAMNQRARELGMNDTNFVNASGLDADGHVSSAHDIALMSQELLKHELITQYSTIWMDTLRGGETSLVNTNKLVRFYNGATGLKTGTTDDAGKCLSASAMRDNLSLVAVVLGSETSDDRFNSARNLLDYGFANWEVTSLPPMQDAVTPVPVLGGVENLVNIDQAPIDSVVVQKGRKDDITYEVALAEDVAAPVEKGQVLGRVSILLDDTEITSYELRAAESVEKMTFGKAFSILIEAVLDLS